MKPLLTDKHRKIYEFIENKIVNFGQPPTIREIGSQFKISSTNGVRTHLTALIKKGYLIKHGYLSRGLELAHSLAGQIGRVKIVGSVPAGHPIDAVENMEGELALDLSFLLDNPFFDSLDKLAGN